MALDAGPRGGVEPAGEASFTSPFASNQHDRNVADMSHLCSRGEEIEQRKTSMQESKTIF